MSCGSVDPVEGSSVKKPAKPHILTINGGSSSIKFAQFEAGDAVGHRVVHGGPNYCDPQRNAKNAGLISPDEGRVKVRVIHTDEALMIARSVAHLLNLGPYRKPQP